MQLRRSRPAPSPLSIAVLGAFFLSLAPRAARPAEPPPALALDLGGVRLDLVLVKAGRFRQGSPPTEAGRAGDEAPRDVTLTRDFYLGKFPVTVGQFARFAEETGYRTEAEIGASGGFGFDGKGLSQRKEFTWKTPGFPQSAGHPVTLVTFEDASAFTRWLTAKTGRAFALPTEAQWEYAHRAGTQTRFYAGSGDEAAALVGWFKGNAGNGTMPVGQKQPNAFGLHDMSGNVYEWCRDWYAASYAPAPAIDPEQTTPPGGDKPRRVLRGGSWLKDAKHLRAAARYRNDPGSRNADNGFRVAAALEVSAPAAAPPSPAPVSAPRAPGPRRASLPATAVAVIVGGGLFLASGLIGLIGLLVHRARRRHPMAGAPPGVTFRPAGDGFWLHAPPELAGSTLQYRCRVHGQLRRAAVPIEPIPRGQFVYTGGAPSAVEAEHIGPPARGAAPPWPAQGAQGGAAPSWPAQGAQGAAGRWPAQGAQGAAGRWPAQGPRAAAARRPAQAAPRARASSSPDWDDAAPFRGYPSAY